MGQHDSRTAYFWGERSWGGPIAGPCQRVKPDRDKDRDKPGKGKEKPPKPPTPEPTPTPEGGG